MDAQITFDASVIPTPAIVVTLSRRNLVDLLAQLEKNGHGSIARLCADGVYCTVTVEENELHYGDRKPGPGGLK